jgi:signal transduction histidine kinase/CheY-like chemotaxis protein
MIAGRPYNILDDYQINLVRHLTQLVMVFSAVGLYFTLAEREYPHEIGLLLLGLMVLGAIVYRWGNLYLAMLRRLLVLALATTLLIGMTINAGPWLPFLGLLLPFVGSILVSRSGFFAVLGVFAYAFWLHQIGERDYPLAQLAVGLMISVALAWRTIDTLYTTLMWYTTTQQEANRLLDEARTKSAELQQVVKSLETAYDIRSRMQRELKWLRQNAIESQRMKEGFAANISHEIRTPLNLILGFSEMMHLSPEVYGDVAWPATLRRDIYQIYRNSRHLLEMIDDILDLSQFEMNRFTINIQPTDLNQFMAETVEIAQDIFHNSPAKLEVVVAPDLPPLEIDRTRIRQAIINLLNNARRFTDSGIVRLEVYPEGERVLFSVVDTGPGIPQQQLDRIFEEFYQVDYSLSRRHGGAGLGLTITRNFVLAHQGEIWAESVEGQGSTFTFALPITTSRQTPPSHTSQPMLAKPRPCVLVLEPSHEVVQMVERYLSDFEIIQVAEMSALATAIAQYTPWAILHNVSPQQMSISPPLSIQHVPYIQCSLPSQRWIAEELTVSAYLAKPISPGEFVQQIDQHRVKDEILLIDDDRAFAQLVERILNAYRPVIRLVKVYDGESALASLRSSRPDLVFLDLGLPDWGGLNLLKAIQQLDEVTPVPVVLLTAAGELHEMFLQQRGNISISRAGGFYPSEALGLIRACVDVMKPTV